MARLNRFLFVTFTTLAAIGQGTVAHGKEAKTIVSLQPSSDWNIEFGEDRCRLSRMFGPSDDLHIVYFEQAGPSKKFGITMAGQRLRMFRQHFNHLSLKPGDGFPRLDTYWGEIKTIGPAATALEFDISEMPEEAGEDAGTGSLQALPAIDLKAANTINRILFGHGGTAISFETGNMAPPFQALNACASDFVRAWGLDQEEHLEFQSMPQLENEPKTSREIKKRYPARSRDRGQQEIMRVIAIIEADGSLSDCWIQNASQADHFDSPACEVLGKAKFKPAYDREGKPMRSYFMKTLNYQIIPASAHG